MTDPTAVAFYTALGIFALTYAGIFTLRISRTVLAIAGAVMMTALGTWMAFYGPEPALGSIDADTITLLFGMMVVVALFRETGFFQFVAIRAAKWAHGKPWLLLIYLGAVTAVVSMVLDNVTTILILVPVTTSLADILGVSPIPFLMGEVLSSNIGGVGTLIGDPPNILIGSAAGFSFVDFVVHLLPIVILVWIAAQALLLVLFRRQLFHVPAQVESLMRMDERRAVVDPRTTRRMLIVLGGTVLLFFLHQSLGIGPGLVALFGASAGLLWVRPDFEKILKEVHWDVLLFFIALFVLVGGLEASGVTAAAGAQIASLARHGSYFPMLIVLWFGALASGVVSNVPLTIAMLPVFKGMAAQGIAVEPLWWALALGVGFGANLTPLASAANVVVSSLAASIGEPLTFRKWLQTGTRVALASCAIASIALVAAHAIGWI
ncbi:MAG: ArsB/NhaD family transporter [Candidatus Bipolaricaulota bacterium]